MTKTTGIAVALAVIVALGFLFLGNSILMPFGLGGTTETQTNTQTNTMTDNNPTVDTLEAAPGMGEPAQVGDTVSVNYVGRFQDGTVFDSSASAGAPITFVLGAGKVIKGWDQGIVGMKVGEKRQLVVPPELGYGPMDYGPIPGNSTLIFDIEIMAIQKAK